MSYGADTDLWGRADTMWELQSSSESPGKSEAQCVDSNGDIEASTLYDTVTEISCSYKMKINGSAIFYDTATSVDFRLGKVINSYVITGITMGTNNTDFTDLTISGRSCPSADSVVSKYQPTDSLVTIARKAQFIGVSDTSGVTRCTGSSYTASVSVATCMDSVGTTAALDVYGGREEATNSLVGCTGDPIVVADTGWTLSSGPSNAKENTAYGTGDVTVFKNIARDT